MIQFKLKNLELNKNFMKGFESPFLARQFMLKVKHGSSLKILDISCDTSDEYAALMGRL